MPFLLIHSRFRIQTDPQRCSLRFG